MPNKHTRSQSKTTSGTASRRSHRGWKAAIVGVSVAVLAVGVAAFVVHPRGDHPGPSAGSAASAVEAAQRAVPFTVSSTSPTGGATSVPTDAPLDVQLSSSVAPGSPTPTLNPPVAGSWQLVTPTTFSFIASAPLIPSTHETITVPGGAAGVVSTTGRHLAQADTVSFTAALGTYTRLQQLLAEAGYLPLTFTPSAPLSDPAEAAQPQEGGFAWKWAPPSYLSALWTPGSANVITQGAVMAFEDHNGLTPDGIAGPAVWQKLLATIDAGTLDASPYDYVYVSKTIPESATVYSNGQEVYSTPANTGVPGAPTQSGTFPVYLRYKVTTMSGTNPNGTKYHDPGIPWVSYFNGGDALHGFVRASYGYPQSDGCVEMPPANAAVVYPLTPIGTLVTIS